VVWFVSTCYKYPKNIVWNRPSILWIPIYLRNNGFVSFVLRVSRQASWNGSCADHEGVGVSESMATLNPNLSMRGDWWLNRPGHFNPYQVLPASHWIEETSGPTASLVAVLALVGKQIVILLTARPVKSNYNHTDKRCLFVRKCVAGRVFVCIMN
jgi:hypothetical protein